MLFIWYRTYLLAFQRKDLTLSNLYLNELDNHLVQRSPDLLN